MARRAYPKATPARKIVSVRGESGGMVEYSGGTVRLRNNRILFRCSRSAGLFKTEHLLATSFSNPADSFGNSQHRSG